MRLSPKPIWCCSNPEFWLVIFAGAFLSTGVLTAQDEQDIRRQGSKLVYKYCYVCHNADDDYYNILDHDQVVDNEYAVKGNAAESLIWQRLSDADEPMPPEDAESFPTDAEKQVLKAWVEAGAPLMTEDEIKAAISDETGSRTVSKQDAESIAVRGTEVIEKFCYDCHGGKATKGKLDIFAAELDAKYTGGGDAGKSKIWDLVQKGKMPKKGAPMPDDDEKELIRLWLAGGARVVRTAKKSRSFVTVKQEMQSMDADLNSMRESDRQYARYFSLRNVHNNFQRYSQDDLHAHQAALAKVVNSLSWDSDIVPPKKVDAAGTLWRIDLRDYQWDQPRFQQLYDTRRLGVWHLLCSRYPYGISYSDAPDQQVRDLHLRIEDAMQLRGQHPVMRADWFCFNATQTDMYYIIMGIPQNLRMLEHDLGVDLTGDFRGGELNRFAVKESGVSVGNRLMDRHKSKYGHYWISYDFKEGGSRNDLRRYPLGPVYEGHPYREFAFEHDGGEVVFSLPNQLQAYVLTDDKGNRLEEGPIKVVQDEFEATGDSIVTNAVSCMKCHASGMKEFEDDIRETIAIRSGDALRFAEDLFDPRDQLPSILRKDGQAFRDAFMACLEDVVPLEQKWFEIQYEPVGTVTNKYMAPLNAMDAAIELEMEMSDEAACQMMFKDSALQRFGLRALSTGHVVKRNEWDSRNEGGDSIFQKAAVTLERGRSSSYSHNGILRVFELYRQQK